MEKVTKKYICVLEVPAEDLMKAYDMISKFLSIEKLTDLNGLVLDIQPKQEVKK